MRLLFFILLYCNSTLYAQVQIRVLDNEQKPVPNAIIILNNSDVIETNEEGFCSADLDTLNNFKVSRLGYSSLDTTIVMSANTIYLLLSRETELSGVTIKSNAVDFANKIGNAIQIDKAFIEKVPSLTGSYDITKALKVLPGVSESYEFSSGLIVRGGLQNQNQFLLDHVPIYNLSHFGGLLPVVNGDMVESMDFYKGPIPAKYGGRLSSIVSLNSKTATKSNREIKYNLGMLDAGLSISIPLIKHRLSILSTSRFLHVAPFTLISNLLYKRGRISEKANFGFYDSYNKIDLNIDDKSSLSFSYFTTKDYQNIASGVFDMNEEKLDFHWSNNIYSLIYKRSISKKLYFKQIFSSSNYTKANVNTTNFNGIIEETQFGNRISGVGIHSKFDYFGSNNYVHTFGSIISRRTLQLSQSRTDSEIENRNVNNNLSIYSDHSFNFNKITLQAGIRLEGVHFGRGSEIAINPRFNLNYELSESHKIGLGTTNTSQSVFNVSSALVGLTNELWFQVSEDFKLQRSWIYNLSYQYDSSRFTSNGSIFLKNQNNLIDDQILLDIDQPLELKELSDIIQKDGESVSYGLEYWAKYDFDKLNIMLSYTYSKTKIKFPGVFDGAYFNSTFDRPHQLNFVVQRNINDRWSMFMNFTFQSGLRYSYPSLILTNPDGTTVPYYTGRNQFALPTYHRLDLGLKRKWYKKSRNKTLNINIFNAYNNKNVSLLRFTNSDPAKLEKVTLIPLILSLSYYCTL